MKKKNCKVPKSEKKFKRASSEPIVLRKGHRDNYFAKIKLLT